MIINFYKELTRNLDIGNSPVLVLPNIWGMGRASDTNFNCFWVIKGKPTRGLKLPPIQIRVKTKLHSCFLDSCEKNILQINFKRVNRFGFVLYLLLIVLCSYSRALYFLHFCIIFYKLYFEGKQWILKLNYSSGSVVQWVWAVHSKYEVVLVSLPSTESFIRSSYNLRWHNQIICFTHKVLLVDVINSSHLQVNVSLELN